MVKESFIKLIDKYLSGTATDSEQQLIEEYLTRMEVDDSATLENDEEQKLKEAMWQQIQLQTARPTAEVVQMAWYRRRAVRSIAVAASILLLIGLGVVLFTNNNRSEQPIVEQNDKGNDTTALSFLQYEVNTTGKEKRVQLPDGSLIVLADKSEVIYRSPFGDRRDVTLVGKALFKVTKDETKPFTVYSGNISTTALGTEFTVTAFENTNRIVVRLYEGKVVVKPVKANKNLSNDVYLVPGQEFVYDDKLASEVNKFQLSDAVTAEDKMSDELSMDNPSIPQNTSGSWFMFNNQSLDQVFDQLAEIYNVKIIYSKKDIQNMYFIGKFEKSDSLGYILRQIGILNNLTITRKDTAFVVTR